MCGRLVQIDGMDVYTEKLCPRGQLFSGYDARPITRYNGASPKGKTARSAR